MAEVHYLISDASKQVDVESHVLRYWEEELELNIPRNDMGHRYYTEYHIHLFRQIKELKEKGYQLKAIKNALNKMAGVAEEITITEDYMEEDMKAAWHEGPERARVQKGGPGTEKETGKKTAEGSREALKARILEFAAETSGGGKTEQAGAAIGKRRAGAAAGELPQNSVRVIGQSGETLRNAARGTGQAGEVPGNGARGTSRSGEAPGSAVRGAGRSGEAPGNAARGISQAGEVPGNGARGISQSGEMPPSAARGISQAREMPGNGAERMGQAGEMPRNAARRPVQTGEPPQNAARGTVQTGEPPRNMARGTGRAGEAPQHVMRGPVQAEGAPGNAVRGGFPEEAPQISFRGAEPADGMTQNTARQAEVAGAGSGNTLRAGEPAGGMPGRPVRNPVQAGTAAAENPEGTGRRGQEISPENMGEQEPGEAGRIARREDRKLPEAPDRETGMVRQKAESMETNSEKMARFQSVMNHIIGRAMDANMDRLAREVSETVSEDVTDRVMKEVEYLMRVSDEKEEERFRQLDETIRAYQKQGRSRAEAAAARVPFFKKKKFGRSGKKMF